MALVIAMLLMVLLLLMGTALLSVSTTESAIAANDQWSEGAFQAADAAVQLAIDRLNIGETDGIVEVTEIGDFYEFRSGGRWDDEPQPPEFVREDPGEGYSVDEATGYNSTQYVFETYRINGTGTGPKNAVREVEVMIRLGPIAK
jgi:hypothetical protein